MHYWAPFDVVGLATGISTKHANEEFQVTKVNPKNLKVTSLTDGKNYTLPKAAAIFIRKSTVMKTTNLEVETIPVPSTPKKIFRNGMLVRHMKPTKYSTIKDLWVVGGVNEKTITLYKFGGNVSGQYLRVPPSYLEEIDVNKFMSGQVV